MADTKWAINTARPVNASQGSNVVLAQTTDQPQTLHIYSTVDALSLITLQFDTKVDFQSIAVNWTAIAEQRCVVTHMLCHITCITLRPADLTKPSTRQQGWLLAACWLSQPWWNSTILLTPWL
jgi:hypothetical protein